MINAKKRFFNNIIRVGIFGIFASLFLSGVTFGYSVINECYKYNPTSNNASTLRPCLDFQPGEQLTIGEYSSFITGNFNFMSDNPLIFSSSLHFVGSSTYDSYSYTFYQNDGYITTFNTIYGNGNLGGTFIYTGGMYCLVSDTTNSYNFGICSAGNYANSKMYSGTVDEAIAYMTGHTIIGYRLLFDFRETTQGQINDSRNRADMGICAMLDNNTAICIKALGGFNGRQTNCNSTTCVFSGVNRTQDTNMGTGDITYSDLLSTYNLSSSPFTVNFEDGGGTFIPLDSDVDMVINYYEQRGYRESMCYVGTDNLTATFGTSGVSFEEGSGDSIFGLYNSIYDGFGNNIIQNVGKFINVRDINYGQWFYCDSENCPRWLAELTGNDVNINLNYTGLTFPFVNKPVAIYFMASNLSETYNIDTHGFDVAFYCYSKLNRDSIADGSIDYSDIKEKAGSGVLDKIDTYNQYLIDYYTPKGTFQVPTSGEFWNSFLSGEDYSGVNNVDMSDTFSNYFTRITNIFQNYSPQYSTGIIPDWIIFPLIFLILFRIMKH